MLFKARFFRVILEQSEPMWKHARVRAGLVCAFVLQAEGLEQFS